MISVRTTISTTVLFILVLLLTVSMHGQFRETYEPPGYLLQWGGSGSGDGQFNSPTGVAIDTLGNLYVADYGQDRVQKFDADGNFLTKWGSTGSGEGQFNNPVGIAVDASGSVYVVDHSDHRIQKFDTAGNFLTKWGSAGTGDGEFNSPQGVATDSFGNVYVADYFNDRIQKFDSMGNFLAKWGTHGAGDGEFDGAADVATDSSGNVYVADVENHRVQKFDNAGNFLAKWGTWGPAGGEFNSPQGVAADSSGYVYVSDYGNHRIQKFDSAGNFLSEWGSEGSGDGQLDWPRGVAVDASGNVYVADYNNHRIQRFTPVLWFDVAGYDSYLSVTALHETTANRTLLKVENNGAPRFAFKNSNSNIEWSFQQSGSGNFLISREGTGGPELQVFQTGMVRMGPGGARNFTLSPVGNLTISGSLTANGSKFPDYVFEPDYDLMPLPELHTYIQREKRLPDIPSAEDVQQQGGHNMTELQLKLLEKIEELTLYILEQDKKLQEVAVLKARLAAIEAKMPDSLR